MTIRACVLEMGDTFFAPELQYVLKMVEGRNFKVLTSKQSANFSKFSNQTFNDLWLENFWLDHRIVILKPAFFKYVMLRKTKVFEHLSK